MLVSVMAGQIGGTMHEEGGHGQVMRAIGLMSGTSMDGIDVAVIETDGEDAVVRGPASQTLSLRRSRSGLGSHKAMAEARSLTDRDAAPGIAGRART